MPDARQADCTAEVIAEPSSAGSAPSPRLAYSGHVKWVSISAVGCAVVMSGTALAVGEGRFVVQQGIAGLRLGMTQAQVKAKVGLPRKVERGSSEIGPSTTYHYRTYSVTFFAGPNATQMDTLSPKERTLRGIGVGSTRAEVRAKVAGVRCLKEFGYDHCYVGVWKPGGKITDFSIKDGRVARVSIGYIID